ncbi:putative leader peptide [Streptomyces sp. NPDC102395]|uniref:putative leader peptide n=1 Tax=Streptomyces sp. NPDC102395 TaxID=3366168 RepID=UPI003800C332
MSRAHRAGRDKGFLKKPPRGRQEEVRDVAGIPSAPRLTSRVHIDLQRVAGALCRS